MSCKFINSSWRLGIPDATLPFATVRFEKSSVVSRLELSNIFDQMEKEEAEMSRLGILKIEEYEKVKQEVRRRTG